MYSKLEYRRTLETNIASLQQGTPLSVVLQPSLCFARPRIHSCHNYIHELSLLLLGDGVARI